MTKRTAIFALALLIFFAIALTVTPALAEGLTPPTKTTVAESAQEKPQSSFFADWFGNDDEARITALNVRFEKIEKKILDTGKALAEARAMLKNETARADAAEKRAGKAKAELIAANIQIAADVIKLKTTQKIAAAEKTRAETAEAQLKAERATALAQADEMYKEWRESQARYFLAEFDYSDLKEFQRIQELKAVDGTLGPETWNRIKWVQTNAYSVRKRILDLGFESVESFNKEFFWVKAGDKVTQKNAQKVTELEKIMAETSRTEAAIIARAKGFTVKGDDFKLYPAPKP